MADSFLVCSYAAAVGAALTRYRHKVQRQRLKRMKQLRQMRQARYRWFITKKRLLTLLE